MSFPLRYRIAVITVLCLLPVVVVTSTALVRLATRDLWQEAGADAVAFADTVRRATRHAMLTFDRPQLDAILQTVSRQRGILAVRLYDDRGGYRLPAGREAPDLDLAGPACTACHPDARRAELQPGLCLHRGEGSLRLYTPIPSEPACVGAGCHANGQGLLGVLEVETDESHIERQIESLAGQATVGAAVVLLAAALPLLVAFRWALQRPLTECLRLVRAVARGELKARSRVRRADEWGELLGAFDSMIGALSGARGDLEALNRDLERQVTARTADLQVALAAAQESDRMKTEFLAGISHELSTPLQAVIGYADLLLDGIEGDMTPDQLRDVETIRRNGGTLLQLVENLLELARLEGHRRVLCVDRIRVEDVAEAVVETGRRLAAGKPVEVALEVEPGCPVVLGEATALRNTLFHLVENAVRPTERGSVRVVVRAGEDGWLELEVADTGPGMDPEVLRSALKGFAPKGGGGGVGIGLALARRIVELHGGQFSVESAVGQGTRVTVRLPP
ncbi:MAG: HAMP domain-containing histidine kinase, partial [Proteobacteria bacterium]|nr:HAMP domain-containing histidine kinase [Pseudomonadota bacterium]